MTYPTLIVCGLGRCGSTLLMTMLAAADYPVEGEPPDFEDSELDLDDVSGAAAKCLTPHETPIPADAVVVRLRRDPREQAASQVKVLHSVGLLGDRGKRARAAFRQRLLLEERAVSRRLAGRVLVDLRFEQLLEDPRRVGALIASATGVDLDLDAMAAVVFQRPSACMPDMQIEQLLIESLKPPAPASAPAVVFLHPTKNEGT